MPDNQEKTEQYAMRSVDRVAAILNCLATGGTCSLTDIAAETGLPRPTVLRIAEALSRHGLVARADNLGYRLGARLVFMALKNSGIVDLKAAAEPVMLRLVQHTGETAALAILVGSKRMYIRQVESSQNLRQVIQLNTHMPVHAGASGKVMLAWLPESRALEMLAAQPMERYTHQTVTEPSDLLPALRAIRKTGYAISLSEMHPDGAGVAAPILTQTGEVLGAIAVLAPLHRTPEGKLVDWGPLVQEAAYDIAVGYGAFSPLASTPLS